MKVATTNKKSQIYFYLTGVLLIFCVDEVSSCVHTDVLAECPNSLVLIFNRISIALQFKTQLTCFGVTFV